MMSRRTKGREKPEEWRLNEERLVSFDGQLDSRTAPKLSDEAIANMLPELQAILKTNVGRELWGKIYSVLHHYLHEDRNDYVLMEQFRALYGCHFWPIVDCEKDFKVQQRELFAAFQQFVHYECDVFGAVRLYLREKPLEDCDLKHHSSITTKLGKTEMELLRAGFEGVVCKEMAEFTAKTDPAAEIILPLLQEDDLADKENVIPTKRAKKLKDVNLKRKMIFELLIYHHPAGLVGQQLQAALALRYPNSSVRPTFEEVEKYMTDIVVTKRKFTWKFMRVRLDVAGICISEKLLKRQKLLKNYRKASKTRDSLENAKENWAIACDRNAPTVRYGSRKLMELNSGSKPKIPSAGVPSDPEFKMSGKCTLVSGSMATLHTDTGAVFRGDVSDIVSGDAWELGAVYSWQLPFFKTDVHRATNFKRLEDDSEKAISEKQVTYRDAVQMEQPVDVRSLDPIVQEFCAKLAKYENCEVSDFRAIPGFQLLQRQQLIQSFARGPWNRQNGLLTFVGENRVRLTKCTIIQK